MVNGGELQVGAGRTSGSLSGDVHLLGTSRLLLARSDDLLVNGDLDGNGQLVQAGGGDILAWIKRLSGRLPFIHLKDYGIGPDLQPGFRELGRGNLDLPAIVDAATTAGCEWFIVEQDICPADPFDSLRVSYEYLAALARD